jgi:hypothetical protein
LLNAHKKVRPWNASLYASNFATKSHTYSKVGFS